jgi:hypothetical protein
MLAVEESFRVTFTRYGESKKYAADSDTRATIENAVTVEPLFSLCLSIVSHLFSLRLGVNRPPNRVRPSPINTPDRRVPVLETDHVSPVAWMLIVGLRRCLDLMT